MVKVYVLRQAPAGSVSLAPVIESPKIVAAVPPLPRPKLTSESNDEPPALKRTRLTGLNHEEKLERRKLKNRIAAQTARDRKKARMDELEDLVRQMEREKELLIQENIRLKSQSTELVQQNKSLRSMIMGNFGSLSDSAEGKGSLPVSHSSPQSGSGASLQSKGEVIPASNSIETSSPDAEKLDYGSAIVSTADPITIILSDFETGNGEATVEALSNDHVYSRCVNDVMNRLMEPPEEESINPVSRCEDSNSANSSMAVETEFDIDTFLLSSSDLFSSHSQSTKEISLDQGVCNDFFMSEPDPLDDFFKSIDQDHLDLFSPMPLTH